MTVEPADAVRQTRPASGTRRPRIASVQTNAETRREGRAARVRGTVQVAGAGYLAQTTRHVDQAPPELTSGFIGAAGDTAGALVGVPVAVVVQAVAPLGCAVERRVGGQTNPGIHTHVSRAASRVTGAERKAGRPALVVDLETTGARPAVHVVLAGELDAHPAGETRRTIELELWNAVDIRRAVFGSVTRGAGATETGDPQTGGHVADELRVAAVRRHQRAVEAPFGDAVYAATGRIDVAAAVAPAVDADGAVSAEVGTLVRSTVAVVVDPVADLCDGFTDRVGQAEAGGITEVAHPTVGLLRAPAGACRAAVVGDLDADCAFGARMFGIAVERDAVSVDEPRGPELVFRWDALRRFARAVFVRAARPAGRFAALGALARHRPRRAATVGLRARTAVGRLRNARVGTDARGVTGRFRGAICARHAIRVGLVRRRHPVAFLGRRCVGPAGARRIGRRRRWDACLRDGGRRRARSVRGILWHHHGPTPTRRRIRAARANHHHRSPRDHG